MDRARVMRDMSGIRRSTVQTGDVTTRPMRSVTGAMRRDVYEGWLAEWGLRPETWSGYCGYGSIEARGDPSMRGRAGKEAWNLWGFTGSRESYWWAYDLLSPAYIDLAVKR